MNLYEVIKRPVITEKTTRLKEANQYVFEVDPRANCHQIREAVEKIFNVRVLDVRIMNVPAKRRRDWRARILSSKPKQVVRRPSWKKAIVKIAPGQRIDIFEV
ncbi:50S ribosomal protein L23 [Thermoflexus sp.]|uniref:50S ribosomal protein L23 n=1 Tax=Thermoflexus sp. TaxID=1969742 RepID=UPI0025E54487|nr:50S ribosomal protein L23 [Thermoflexus sp.]MDW8180409.1 50S ribosomal protein L23 [Anaerolineae bacterium]MCS6963340.1 50S ribosomal protein L23 [Thermoflexus sp.]MCS7350957.1 50S ribosomal protein L23 [Thermoflexus sp.]MCX7691145.1 50S ribosomal protein L23 [Thermoflexus sp.]MDW8184223.1 50S ribosomal protein L23 [Anaerolineae bacterium]